MRYPNAPITEAIFDIRVDQLENADISIIRELENKIKSKFPVANKHFKVSGAVTFDQKTESVVTVADRMSVIGLIFSTEDQRRRVQARLDGYTFNMLQPYTEWSDFFSSAFEIWELYNEVLKPKTITRIALRYINKIILPVPLEFSEYFTCMPQIPKVLPQSFSGFFVQMAIPIYDKLQNVIITQTIETYINNTIPYILDIDVYKVGSFEKSSLYTNFEDLRIIKNEVFESCITDKTRNLFK
jgi:uncharacterized protein (TIGR04255 family)